jgi:hypothetical protein
MQSHPHTSPPPFEPLKMSLAGSSDYFFRPDPRKAVLPTDMDDNNHFDDFFKEEMYRLGTSDGENEEQWDRVSDYVFTSNTMFKDPFSPPSREASPKVEQPSVQPWKQGVWCLKQRQQPSTLVVEKTRKLETKRPEPIQTMNLNNQNYQGLISPPETFSTRAKRFATSPTAQNFSSPSYNRIPFSREQTLSPSPMYSQLPISPRHGHGDIGNWQQDFQHFHLRQQYEPKVKSPLASPLRHVQTGNTARRMNAAVMVQNQEIGVATTTFDDRYSYSGEHGAIDPVLLDPDGVQYDNHAATQSQEQLMSSLLNSPPSFSLPSSIGSEHSRDARTHTSNTSRSAQSRPVQSPTETTYHPPLPTLEPDGVYPDLAAPKPKRIPHPVLQQPVEMPLTGLGIHYPELEQMNQAVFYDQQAYYQPMSAPMGMAVPYPAVTTAAMSMSMTNYPPLPPPPTGYVFADGSPFTPRKQRRSPTRSPSPPMSPTNISPRRNGHRSPVRNVTDYAHHRRKSIHKTGPIKDGFAQEPMPTTRARSSSRPRTSKAPKTPTGGGQIDFVNFTPRDSAKLLNDVAPSGSSKTRARRELEAREKRKKLGEVAKLAVQVAGGDVEVFEKVIMAKQIST